MWCEVEWTYWDGVEDLGLGLVGWPVFECVAHALDGCAVCIGINLYSL